MMSPGRMSPKSVWAFSGACCGHGAWSQIHQRYENNLLGLSWTLRSLVSQDTVELIATMNHVLASEILANMGDTSAAEIRAKMTTTCK